MAVLQAVAKEPCGLAELCTRTGLPRATAHRLAVGLEVHRLLRRGSDGRWRPGAALAELAGGATDPLLDAASTVRWMLGSAHAARTLAPEPAVIGARLPMTAGSGAKVLAAWADPSIQRTVLAASSKGSVAPPASSARAAPGRQRPSDPLRSRRCTSRPTA